MTRLSYVVCFLGGCSFLGFHFLPTWLMAPLFFVTPAAGPLLLALTALVCMARARRTSEKLTAARLAAAVLIGCVLVLIPVAAFDLLFFGTVPYVGPLILIVAVPFHVACVGFFGAGLYALAEAQGVTRARPIAVAAVAGFVSGIVVTAVRVEIVPRSAGVFLKSFSGSGVERDVPGRPLNRYGQRDVAETLGVQPRRYHEPIAAIGDDDVWLTQRTQDGSCSGYWIERKGLARDAAGWRRCLPKDVAPTRNPTAMAFDARGGVFVAGFDVRDDGGESAWLTRYDDKGVEDERWSKSFGEEATLDRAYAVRPSRDGAVYVAGESGEIDRRGTFGWVRKFTADGSEARDGWPLRFRNAGERRPTMAAIAVAGTSEGDVYVLLDLFNALSVHTFDAGGRELWQKDLPGHKDVAIVAGADALFVVGTAGYPDQAWIKKVNAAGEDEWEKTFALGHLSATLAVAVDAERSVYVAGYGTEPGDKASYWWIKNLGPDGSERWQRILSGPDNQNAPFQLHLNAAGELYALGKGNGWQFSGSLLEKYWGW